MNILIVKLSAVGDVVHTLPALAALRRHYPQAHITWVIEEAASDLVIGHPDLDRIIVSGRKRWIKTWRQRETRGEIRTFFRALRDRSYDLIIDFHGLFKSAVLVGLCRGRRKLGYASIQEGSCLFYTERIAEDMNKHAVDRYLDLIRHLGAETGRALFTIPETSENRDRAAVLLRGKGIEPGRDRFIAVNPVALWATKLWDIHSFAILSERIIRELRLPVVLTGSIAERPYLDEIQATMGLPVANLAGRTSLRDLAALYRLAALVVTTDSGPMHIAAAVDTPVVALFGPTDPDRTGPYGEGHTVIRQSLPCSPCLLKACESRQCMAGIGVEDVFEAVKKQILETKRKEERVRNDDQ